MGDLGDAVNALLWVGILLLILPTLIAIHIPTAVWIIGIIVVLYMLLRK